MKIIYKTIFVLSTFFICCCKQDKGEKPKIQDETKNFASGHTATNEETESFEETDNIPNKSHKQLLEKYNKIQALFKKPEGFQSSCIEEIEGFFNTDYKHSVNDNLYYTLNFDTTTIDNLKKIITTFGSKKDYHNPAIGESLVRNLSYLIINIMRKIDNSFSRDNRMNKLKNTKNLESLNEIAKMLDDAYIKWNMFVSLIQKTINNAASLTNKKDVIHIFKMLNELKSYKTETCSTNNAEICKLKNELIVLSTNIENKITELITGKVQH
ncbi:hypothetical protein BDCR2A_01122 [Borrelia duttonii CR2A]|uniref:Antigen P35 n=3 Tax=Borrelia duttonii TaxID=40834 RepID=W6TG85_9SPIR|nr:hypothetical protein [Borrelia duttonii]ETZ17927.1 hypothetical protein BDCR2A_01122 [Borrelia duttonii CR2A]